MGKTFRQTSKLNEQTGEYETRTIEVKEPKSNLREHAKRSRSQVRQRMNDDPQIKYPIAEDLADEERQCKVEELREAHQAFKKQDDVMKDKELFHYIEISANTVNMERRKVAGWMRDYFVAKHNIPSVTIHWIKQQTNQSRDRLRELDILDSVKSYAFEFSINGFCGEGQKDIYLSSDESIDFLSLATLIAHELVHSVQDFKGLSHKECERAARNLSKQSVYDMSLHFRL